MISRLLPITVKEMFEKNRDKIVKRFGEKFYQRLMAVQVSKLEIVNVMRHLAENKEDGE
jgi:hypothetical protein